MISDDQLKEWRALCEKATPGEWRVINEIDPNPIFLKTWGPDYKTMWFIQRGGENDKPNFSTLVNVTPRETMMAEQDVRFIAASRTAVPALLDEVEELRKAVRIRNDEAMIFRRERDDLRAKLDKARYALDRVHRGLEIGIATVPTSYAHEQVTRTLAETA